jgi:hypothetical protein
LTLKRDYSGDYFTYRYYSGTNSKIPVKLELVKNNYLVSFNNNGPDAKELNPITQYFNKEYEGKTSQHYGETIVSGKVDNKYLPSKTSMDGLNHIYILKGQPKEELSKTFKHEMLVHFYNYIFGKPWRHGDEGIDEQLKKFNCE